jgi:dihydropteroate synthase
MGVINRTPDSFFARDPGFSAALDAVSQAVADGADIVDIGGVRAGPGDEVTPAQEIDRVAGLVAAVRERHPGVVISVDTWRAEVGEVVAQAGADLLNDAWGGADPRLAAVAARYGTGLVCSHAGGLPPRTRPHRPYYRDVMADVIKYTTDYAERAVVSGVSPASILVDPAHDFGKNTWQSLEVTRRLGELRETGWPVLVAVSHKDFIGETLGLPVDQRGEGTTAVLAVCAWLGARVFRVHDVRAARAALDAITGLALSDRGEGGVHDVRDTVGHLVLREPYLGADQVVDALEHHQARDRGQLDVLLLLTRRLAGRGHAGGHRLGDGEEQPQPVAEDLLRNQVGLAEDADHGGVRGVRLEELPYPLAKDRTARLVPGDDREVAGHDLHVVQRVLQQGLEQVFLVGEVQVEGPVRDARAFYHVVNADAVEATLLELDHAGVEQPANGLPALRPQLTVLRGGATAKRWTGRLFSGRPCGPALCRSTCCAVFRSRAAACLLAHSKSVAVQIGPAVHSGTTPLPMMPTHYSSGVSSQAAEHRSATAADVPNVTLQPRTVTWVCVMTTFAALLYCLEALLDYRRFLTSTFDLVIFDQGVRGYAHLHAPVSIARGVADGESAHFSLLADHWSPILAVLAPLYWIHDSPATLLVAQGVLFALAIPPLWAYTRRRLDSAPAAYLVCGAYALSLPVMAAVVFDFHEVAFVPVLTAVMVERFDAGRRWHAVLAAVVLLLVKEDMGLLVAGFGLYLLLTRRRWTGLAFVAGGVAATWVATHVLIPAFGGSASFYWAYGQFGASPGSALLNMAEHPLHALRVFFTPWVKTRTMIGLLAAFAFLPLASPMVLAVLPLLAERMLASGYPLWWQAKFQYDAFLVMMLACAAVDGAARLQRRLDGKGDRWLTYPWERPGWLRRGGVPWRACVLWAAAICAAALVYFPSSPFGELLHPKFYTLNARIRAAAAAAAHVPSGTEVEAASNIGPRLSARDTVLLLDGTPRWAPWVVADTIGLDFPFCGPAQQARLVSYLLGNGYTRVFADDGYVVLHRPADWRTRQALAHPAAATRLHTDVCY